MSGNSRQRRTERRQILRASAASVVLPQRQVHHITYGGPVVITAGLVSGEQPAKPPKIDIVAYNGGELLVDAFDLPVVLDYTGGQIPESVPLNIDHNQSFNYLLGSGKTALTGNSLSISGAVTARNANATEVVRAAVEDKFPWQASVKTVILAHSRIPDGVRIVINGRPFVGPIIHAKEWQLTHCAVLGEGADQTSSVSIAAKAAHVLKGSSIMTFEQWLAACGIDATKLTPEGKTQLETAFAASNATPAMQAAAAPAQQQAAPAAQVPQVAVAAAATGARVIGGDSTEAFLSQFRTQQAAESLRVVTIEAKAKSHPDIMTKAIGEGWSVEKTVERIELQNLRDGRNGSGPGIHVHTHDSSPIILTAAFCQAGKLPNIEKHFDTKTLEVADQQYRGAISMQRVLIEAAARNGEYVPPGRLAASNLRRVLKAAFSTAEVSGLLGNTANKFLLDGYNSSKGMEKARRISGPPKSVADFKEAKSFRMIDGGDFEELSPTGKIAHGTLSEESFTNQAKTRAKMYKIPREDLVNDDLGTFDQLRAMIGMGSSRTFLKNFWTEFLDALTTFYTLARGNYQEGAGTALAASSLTTALTLFRKQKTPQGTDLDLEPAILLVPPELEGTADELYTSRTLLYGGTTRTPSDNTHVGKYEPVVVSQLSNSNITGYSAEGWFLLPEPIPGMRVIEVCYLDGIESPTVETADADFDELGIQLRGFFDYGMKKQEYKAAVFSKGKA